MSTCLRMNGKSKIINTICVISVIGIVFMVGITTYAVTYSVMVSDDFWFAADTGRNTGFFQYISASWKHMITTYFTWQGTYFSEMFNTLFNPVNTGGFALLKIMMVFNSLFAYGTLALFMLVATDMFFDIEWQLKVMLIACAVFVLTEYDAFPEIFFWYTGATVNSVPLSLALLSMSLWLIGRSDKKNINLYTVFAFLTGFLAVGGSLAVSGTMCYAVLIIVFGYIIVDKKVRASDILYELVLILGALINAAAPGNFIRQETSVGSGNTISDAIMHTMQVFSGEMEWLFRAHNYLAIIMITVGCGIYLSSKNKIGGVKEHTIVSILLMFTPFVTIFPVVLGYKVPWIPNRCGYILLVTIILAFGNAALFIGRLIGNAIERKSIVILFFALAAVAVFATSDFSVRSYKTVRHVKAIYDGTYEKAYDDTRELMSELSKHQGETVEVAVAVVPDEIDNYYSFYLVDENDRINQAVSWVYGLNSIININNE